MSTYQRYQQARDAAWRTLLECRISALPVNARAIAAWLGVDILPFPAEDDRLMHLLKKAGGVCRSLRIQGKWHIFFRPGTLDDQRLHFAIAHELGHILLHHDTLSLSPGVRAFQSRENEGDVIENPLDLADYAADIFAIRLLAPACVLQGLQLRSREDMMLSCGLPPKAAALRAERMGLLRERNLFLSHPLERQVYDQFLPFIREKNTPALPHLDIPLAEPKLSPWRDKLDALPLFPDPPGERPRKTPEDKTAIEETLAAEPQESPSQPEKKGRKGLLLSLSACAAILLIALFIFLTSAR